MKNYKENILEALEDLESVSVPIGSCDDSVWEKKWIHVKDLINHL